MRKIIDSLVRNKKAFYLKAEGLSMLPILRSSDVLYLKKINFQKININDLIMVKKGRKIITHRVIYKNKDYLITKGDNNAQSDGKIKPNQIMGKVYQIKRNGHIINLENFYLLQSTLYFQEIVNVKKSFEKEKIDFVFLKGLPLHLYFEGSHPRRMYADCDVLIDVEDFGKVGKLLDSFGYREMDTTLSNIHKRLKNKITEVSYYKLINNFPVVFDVHLEVSFLINQFGRLEALYPGKLVEEISSRFLQEKNEVKIHASTFPLLSHENLIFYLTLHFFHHNFRGIHRLEIIDKMTRKSHPELISGSKLIKHYRVESFVYPVFLMLKRYFDTPLSKGFLRSIRPDEDKIKYIMKNIMKTNVFDDETRIPSGISRFKNIFFLSPEPMYKKIFVLLNPAVVYSVFWVILRKLSFLRIGHAKVHSRLFPLFLL